MLVNKVTKMHYLFFSPFVYLSVHPFHPHVFRQESLVAHCLSKYSFPVRVGKTTHLRPPIMTKSSLLFPRILTPFLVAKFAIHICIVFFFLSSILGLFFFFFWSETSSKAMDSWFVYQNIDLFALYTSALALLLVRFFSFSPSPKASPDGPSFSWHQLASGAEVVGSKRDKREMGQYSSGNSCA